MSFILEALRKSEDQRQSTSGPALAHVRTGGPSQRVPRWVLILSVLLVVNLFAMVALSMWSGDSAPAEPAPVVQRAKASETVSAVEKATPGPAIPTPVQTRPVPVTTTPSPARALPATAADSTQSSDRDLQASAGRGRSYSRDLRASIQSSGPSEPEAAPAGLPPAGQARPAQTGIDTSSLPTFEELRARNMVDLPDLNVDIHVYDSGSAGRFVFINMQKYQEGDRLAEGPRVLEITTNGSVLEHQGQRFLLPRN